MCIMVTNSVKETSGLIIEFPVSEHLSESVRNNNHFGDRFLQVMSTGDSYLPPAYAGM